MVGTHGINHIVILNQRLDNTAHILVAHHAKNKMHRLLGIIFIECLTQRLRTVRIMRTVQNDIRILMDTLQAPRPDSIRYTDMQRQLVNAVILLGNKLRSYNRYAGVLNLMLARQLDFVIRMIEIACVQCEGLPLH